MGYDALNVGDNDLKFGLDKLLKLAETANFPFISANIFRQQDTLHPVFEPYLIFQKGDLKLGIIGITSSPKIDTKNLYVGNPIKYYRKYQQEIAEKCDYIIVLAALDTNDEHNFLKRDLKMDLVIFANQYRFSNYLMNQNDIITSFTDNSGKRIVKIQALIEDKTKPLDNFSQINYRYKINSDRMKRYTDAAKGQDLKEYYKKQPTILKVVKRIEKQQKDLEKSIRTLVNPLSYELFEVELKDKQDEKIKKRIDELRKFIGEEQK